jgi:hypothetical protein
MSLPGYKQSAAYLRSNRPELDRNKRPTGRQVWPLRFERASPTLTLADGE